MEFSVRILSFCRILKAAQCCQYLPNSVDFWTSALLPDPNRCSSCLEHLPLWCLIACCSLPGFRRHPCHASAALRRACSWAEGTALAHSVLSFTSCVSAWNDLRDLVGASAGAPAAPGVNKLLLNEAGVWNSCTVYLWQVWSYLVLRVCCTIKALNKEICQEMLRGNGKAVYSQEAWILLFWNT